MNHIYVLENHKLGWWYVGTIKGEDTALLCCQTRRLNSPSKVTEAELWEYLHNLVGGCPRLYFGHGATAEYHMAKRFVSSLLKDIDKNPKNKKNLKHLLISGWNWKLKEWEIIRGVVNGEPYEKPNYSTLWKFKVPSERVAETLEDIKKNWGTPDSENKYRSKKPLTFCLNKKGTGLSAQFLKNRNQIIRNIKKTKKNPKPATLEKYRITKLELDMCLI